MPAVQQDGNRHGQNRIQNKNNNKESPLRDQRKNGLLSRKKRAGPRSVYCTMQFDESLYVQGYMPYGSESRKPVLHLFDREGAKGTKSL